MTFLISPIAMVYPIYFFYAHAQPVPKTSSPVKTSKFDKKYHTHK